MTSSTELPAPERRALARMAVDVLRKTKDRQQFRDACEMALMGVSAKYGRSAADELNAAINAKRKALGLKG